MTQMLTRPVEDIEASVPDAPQPLRGIPAVGPLRCGPFPPCGLTGSTDSCPTTGTENCPKC
jgi:hypothetical protein